MFELTQHTADIRIRIVAASAEELFADGVRALMAAMKPEASGAPTDIDLELDAPDVTALLVDFLNEILLRCHTAQQAFEPESIVLDGAAVKARLTAFDAAAFEEDVKAVTYHEADVRQMDDRSWATTLVLDV